MNTILAELQAAFDEAVSSSSSVLILDDLDELAPNLSKSDLMDDSAQVQQVNPATVDQAKLICDVVRQFLRRREELGRDGLHIVVTCRDAESLPSSLISDGSFGTPIPSPTYNASEREAIFLKMVQRFCTSLDSPVSESTATLDIGGKTRSFMPRDFERLAIRLTRHLSVRDSRGDFKTLLNEEFENFVPLSRLGAAEEAVGGSLSWSDIGGLFDAKSDLTSTILHPSLYRRIYERSRIRLPRGILLFGPPGNGKSVLVPALAQECGYPLIMCRGPELLDKYIGASEAKVRDLFSRAASAAPSILFLDELDALAPRRGSDHTGVTDRVVNQLLTFLDGVEDGSKGGSVYVIAATSRPDKVDPALLRPGRLEKHVYVGYPEQPDELTDLLSKLALKSSVEAETMDLITSGQFIQNAQKDSGLPTGLSAADYQSLFRIAHLSAVHEALAAGRTNEKVMIRYDHLKDAFRSARPSLSSSDYSRLQAVYLPFRNMKDVATHRGADAASGSSTVYRERMLRTALR
jgi:peroxin-1